MATTQDYLTQLQVDKENLVNNLLEKGVEATTDETFTSLVPKVLDISGGEDISEYYNLTKKNSGNILSYIKQIPMIDTSGYTSMDGMFNTCPSLTTIPLLDTSNVTSMANMFNKCSSLITIPQLNTSKVTGMASMFNNCSSLTTIPLLDTSKVTSMNNMFTGCKSLSTIPQLNTSNVTNTSNMFNSCTSLTTIPLLDTSNVTNMSGMFCNCKSITTIPQLNTSKVTNMMSMLSDCTALTTIPQLDTSNVTRLDSICAACFELTTLGGFINLGQAYSTSQSANYSSYTLDLSTSDKLTHDSLMNVINNLYDIATKGCKTQKLVLGSTNLAKLTDEEIAIATNKGWTVL